MFGDSGPELVNGEVVVRSGVERDGLFWWVDPEVRVLY